MKFLAINGSYHKEGVNNILIELAIGGLKSIIPNIEIEKIFPVNYTGNGRTDPGIYRKTSALWAVRGVTRSYLGGPSQVPVPGDYDGDGTTGEGVFRPADSRWQVKLSSGGISQFFLGGNGDFPVPAGYRGGGGQTAAGIFRPATGLWAIRNISRFYFGNTDDLPATR